MHHIVSKSRELYSGSNLLADLHNDLVIDCSISSLMHLADDFKKDGVLFEILLVSIFTMYS